MIDLVLPKIKINWEGSFFVNHSLALVNREICKQLIKEQQFDIGIIPYEEDPNFKADSRIKEHYVTPDSPAAITIQHQWPPNFNKPRSDKWILLQPWEFGAIPRKWYIPMKHWIDEIWVYSTYNKESYVRSGIPEHKVKVIPLGVDENLFHFNVKPFELKTKKSFYFLFVGGTIFRKGIDTLLQAYLDEFSAQDDVCLVIKDFGVNSFYKGQTAQQTIEKIKKTPNHPEILYLNEELSVNDLAGLYKACDCLVHPYRGEGFGLPIIEAMACGTPAIVPSLGPAADFCDEDSAFILPSQEELYPVKNLGEIETIIHPWWIKIDKHELKKKMRFVFENREVAKEKGKNASRKILSAYTWKHTTNRVSNLFQQILTSENSSTTDSQKIIQSEIMESAQLVVSQQLALEQSFEILKSLLDVYPNSIASRYYTALFYLKTNDYQSALTYLLYITNILPTKPKGFETEILKVINEHPDTFPSEIWNFIGICFINLKEWNKAVEAFRNAMGKNPRNIEKVIEIYQKLIADFDKNSIPLHIVDLYHDLGSLYLQMKNDFRAKEMFEKALEIDTQRLDIQVKLDQIKKQIFIVNDSYLNPKPKKEIVEADEIFNRIVNFFDSSDSSLRQRREGLLTYVQPGEKVLDIGSSNSFWRGMLNQISSQTVGIDLANVTQAEDFFSKKTSVYDTIFIGNTIERLTPKELLNLLISCIKTLKPNGKIILIAENINHDTLLENFWLDIRHIRPYPLKLVIRILDSLGLHVKESNLLEDHYMYYVVAQKNCYELLWQSPVFNLSGYAEEQKLFLESLKPYPLKIKMELNDFQSKPELQSNEILNYISALQKNQLPHPLIHYQALPAYAFTMPQAPISIGRTMFETDSLPHGWLEKLKNLTEIWVPSEFNKKTFSSAGLDKEKIFVIPGAIDGERYNPKRVKPYNLGDNQSFKFLSVFDWSTRKGWDLLIRAYFEEFKETDDVMLIIKTSKILHPNAHPQKDIVEMVNKLGIKIFPKIRVIDTPLAPEEMIQLYAAVDAFVLPSRGEGWGYPYMEAMTMGLPTIGTRWSGQLGFMDDNNSLLIDIDGIVPVDPSMPPFFHGHNWAQPSVSHLKKLMKQVFENRQAAKMLGNYARQDMLTRFSKENAAGLIYDRINELIKHHYGSSFG